MRIKKIGNGFIAQHLKYDLIEERLIPDSQQIKRILETYRPNVIINCIGFCGGSVGNIDGCEIEKEKTINSNLIIPTLLANECAKLNIKLIHIGSGCINYGESPNLLVSLNGPKDAGWKETDTPKLQNASFYSKIKYACDLAIGSLSNVCIARIRMPISHIHNPRNLITKLLKYEKVLDAPNSMTFLDDLVKVIDWMIINNKQGIYNVVNPEPLTHINILEEYKKYNKNHKYQPINEEELKQLTIAPRSNCLLNTNKLLNEGFAMTPSFEALERCMKKYTEGT